MNKNTDTNRTLTINTLHKLLNHEQSAYILSMINVPLIVVGDSGLDLLKRYNIDYQPIQETDIFDLDIWLANANNQIGQFYSISRELYLKSLINSPLLQKSTVYI